MINYIIQVILFQVLFLAVYDLFLSKETFFNKNRWYLLGTAIVSFLIPFIKIPSFQKVVPQEISILLPEIMLSPQKVIESTTMYQSTSINYIQILFWLGCAVFFVLFLFKLEKIIRLILKHEIVKKTTYKLVLLPKKSSAFSFFKFIFLGKDIAENKKEKIIQHELVHSSQNHTADLLFFEFLKIVMWFNPMIWMYQNRITLVHEYISDEIVTKETTKENYINNILSDLFQVENISFINQFYKHSLIKKRIIMMTKRKSNQTKQLRYLLLVPVLASMLFYTACTDEVQNTEDAVAKKEVMKVYFGEKNIKSGLTEESYFDLYVGELPSTKELTYNDLELYEKDEYDKFNDKAKGNKSRFSNPKIYEGLDSKKKMLVFDLDKIRDANVTGGVTEIQEVDSKGEISEDVPFSIIETPPTFPGCPEGDKDCFNKKMREFVRDNFDASLGKSLGLSSGKKKIYVQFKIDKDGFIADVNARAPHPDLKAEAVNMIDKLPKMKPGIQRGNKVRVGYTLPITFMIE
ncbi:MULTISPECIES: M56 family metallopeptidase [Tenacibaculum]|uniref:M56 family metallopeptidase n=1 Tax=Tenacibaculum TaxID=104267 RepID=UPI001F0B343C|nr:MULTISPECIES: M56 family metallopeptidase [Tenacibaculum]MCH3882857.1 M56 family metallopeptidase [Tenacibaculum aquimarinum]MDO6600434.1 M56 family metallopeptidase [Tenacibaculum sp. 1_MG-2023]